LAAVVETSRLALVTIDAQRHFQSDFSPAAAEDPHYAATFSYPLAAFLIFFALAHCARLTVPARVADLSVRHRRLDRPVPEMIPGEVDVFARAAAHIE
jgi:hypothetical protein